MSKQKIMTMDKDTSCGFLGTYPSCLQRFATPKCFMVIYGLLGTVQAMAYIYFVVSLTTMERRFKIPSKTTGIMLSGNEISQILLSLFLSYFGGQRNRPKWIAWGVALCSLSCFILALPHFLYGAGEDALSLTKEYADKYFNTSLTESNAKSLLCTTDRPEPDCTEQGFFSEFSLLPVVLVFLSQFVLGIGNTLYYSLGNTYLDDNTKKTSIPKLLGYSSALRTLGPAIGFLLGPLCLSIYIDPTVTPLINKDDARWLGAWWLGWIIMGLSMMLFAFLVGLFPKHLPKIVKVADAEKDLPQYPKIVPVITRNTDNDEIPLHKGPLSSLDMGQLPQEAAIEHNSHVGAAFAKPEDESFPTMKELPQALKRLITNKILMSNIFSGVFYILGASAYITYMAKYIEVQYNQSAVSSTYIVGPSMLIGVLFGFLLSGWYISKYKPIPRRLLAWNVIIGVIFVLGECSYIFMGCPATAIEIQLSNGERSQLINECNSGCFCDGVKYSPVCHKPTGEMFFSACHAGCTGQLPHSQVYTNCTCIPTNPNITLLQTNRENPEAQGPGYEITPDLDWNTLHAGRCVTDCTTGMYMFAIVATFCNIIGASGRIGNILVNYRGVEKRDKSFAQGLLLLLISLFALIPGPIIYGAIIDYTCIEWGEQCGKRTNCLMYNKESFRTYINIAAMLFTSIGVLLDVVVWYLGKDLDLYSEDDETETVKTQKNKE